MTRNSEFGVFSGAETVRCLVAPRVLADGAAAARGDREGMGCEGPRVRRLRRRGGASPIAKFLSEAELEAFRSEPGSTVLFAAGDEATVARVLGGLRIHLGREPELASDEDLFHWVLDFPLFQIDEDTGQWTFLHHPLHCADRRARGSRRPIRETR